MNYDELNYDELKTLTVAQAVEVLVNNGCNVPQTEVKEQLEKDIAEGFPLNDDGTFDFIKYAAFIAKDLHQPKRKKRF